MLVLAYCAGLRLGEIVRLSVGDVNLGGGTIEIRDTKFFKSRRLPLSSSVLSALQSYLDARQQAGASIEPASALFWQERTAKGYSYVSAGQLLRRILKHAKLTPQEAPRTRIHDLRHGFVVNRMLVWYREGVNPCAGINRWKAEVEDALRVRTSDPLGLEFCAALREGRHEA